MAFSLSQSALSRAMGRNGCPIVLVFLVFLFKFLRGILLRPILIHQECPEPIERNNLVRIPFKDGRARHPADHAGILTLRDGHAARGLDCTETLCAIVTHAGHQHANGSESKLLSHGMKKNIGRWTMSIHGRPVGQDDHVAAGHPAHHHVAVSRTDQNAAREQKIAGPRFMNFQRAALVEALRKHFRKTFRHVLHNDESGLKIRGSLRQAARFATLILAINWSAICSRRPAAASLGLGRKSTAPKARALNVAYPPCFECVLKRTTGKGARRMMRRSASIPSMRGISRSSVTTSGRSSSIFFNANAPSMAVPTTSMEESRARIAGISLRISAESSTTRTRMRSLMRSLQAVLRERGAKGPRGHSK